MTAREVWRYELAGPDVMVSMPDGAVPLSVGFQLRAPHALCLWASVDPAGDQALLHVVSSNTGSEHPEGWRFIGTAQDPGTGIVWHVWCDLPTGEPKP